MDRREYRLMYEVETCHWWYQGMAAITRRILECHYRPGDGLRILDAGCGTGAGLQLLSAYGSVTGLDLSPLALGYAARRGAGDLTRGSVMALPFAADSFDLVTSLDVLYYQAVSMPGALGEMARVLRPGGRALVRVAAFDWLRGTHDLKVATARRYSAPELAAGLAASGLELEFLSYANTLLFPLAAVKRLAERWLVRQEASDIALQVGPLAPLLRGCLVLESRLLPDRRLPFGLSVLALARKPLGTPEG